MVSFLGFFDEHVIMLRRQCSSYGVASDGTSFYCMKGATQPWEPWGLGVIRPAATQTD